MSDAVPYLPRCMFLTCKSMMVYGENFRDDPDFQLGMVDFTCMRTCQCLGPDTEEASLDLCSNPERPCFQEY